MQEKDLSQQRARLQALRENYVARMPETFERLEHLIGNIPAQDLPSESVSYTHLTLPTSDLV